MAFPLFDYQKWKVYDWNNGPNPQKGNPDLKHEDTV